MNEDRESCFNRMYDRYKHDLYRYLVFLTRDETESEDLFQETWLRVARHMEKVDDIKQLKAWILTIATNLYRDGLRKKKVRKLFLEKLEKDTSLYPVSVDGLQPDPANNTECEMSLRNVMRTLDRLPEKLRRVFVLREIEGFSYDQIASMLRLSAGTVKSRVHRAVKKIRRDMAFVEPGAEIIAGEST